MSNFSLLSISCAVLILCACDHYSEQLAAMSAHQQDTTQISPAAGGELSFGGYLKSEYMQLALYEQGQYDYKAANYYTKKAKSLSDGSLVSPGSMGEFDIKPYKKEELARAREDLINALNIYNLPENRYTLATAQTRYDCWLEQEEENRENDEVITCKNEFKHSMASLMPPDGREMRFAIAFDEGSLTLSEEARISLERALSFWKNNQSRGYKLILSPMAGVNAEETQQQLSMVRSILQFNGVPASEIGVQTESVSSEEFEILIRRPAMEKDQPSGA